MLKIPIKDFSLKDTLLSGQSFRWERIDGNEFEGVVGNQYIKIRQNGNRLSIDSIPKINDKAIINYFNLDIDYKDIIKKISKDSLMKDAISKFYGMRILNQDEHECLFSYIISSFNSIKKIKMSVELLSQSLGNEIINGTYTFPSLSKLLLATDKNLKDAKLGFRAEYIKKTAQIIKNNKWELKKIKEMKYRDAMNKLTQLPGVGEKVAACTMLYSMNFNEAFPIDTWITKYIKREYPEVTRKEISNKLNAKFENYAGWAQLYMFEYERSSKA